MLSDRASDLTFACLFFVAAMVPVFLVLSKPPKQPDDPILVVAAPWANAGQIIENAGGIVLQNGAFSAFAVGYGRSDGYPAKLRENGAWVLGNGRLQALFCRSTPRGETSEE